jgi:hypothetical protein
VRARNRRAQVGGWEGGLVWWAVLSIPSAAGTTTKYTRAQGPRAKLIGGKDSW